MKKATCRPLSSLFAILALSALLAACQSAPATPPAMPIPGLEATLALQTLSAQQGSSLPFHPTAAPSATSVPVIEVPTLAASTQSADPSTTPVFRNQGSCVNAAEFVQDVSVPDNTSFKNNTRFIKTWRFRNIGSCTWTKNYQVVFIGGDPLGGITVLPLNQEVAKGATVDVSIPFVCPNQSGSYESKWMFKDELGTYFGTGDAARTPFWVAIEVSGILSSNNKCGGGG